MKIKAAFFDIDGTLLSHESKTVPEDARQALRLLREQNVCVFTSTGRHILEFADLPVRDLEFDGYVLLNGQLCLDGQREVLSGYPIDREDILNILLLFEQRDLPIAFVEKDRIYINFIDDRVRTAQKAISSALPTVGEYGGNDVYLVNVFAGEADVREALKQMPHCKMTWWTTFGTDIISKEGGKVSGMRRMLSHYGIAPEEIIAFGDGENDMEMLKFAGIGVAMGNAEPFVKECADYVTDDIDAGGIYNALKHFEIF